MLTTRTISKLALRTCNFARAICISTSTQLYRRTIHTAHTQHNATNAPRREFSVIPPASSPSFPSTSSRSMHTYGRSSFLLHNSTAIPGGKDVHVTFVTSSGERFPVTGKEGENLLALAHANNVELEGACEASLACSTCHVILPEEYYAKLDEPVDEENDMLDLAFGLTDTSRLGCQVKLTTELEGMEITLPSATRNMAVDGHKPKPH